MFWFIGICFIGITIYGLCLGVKNLEEEEARNLASDNPYLINTEVKYLTGFPDKLGDKEYKIKVYGNKVVLSEKYLPEKIITIQTKDLIESRIVSESFIREQIHLGKMLAFGIFSLAMKKKQKKETNNYLQVTINYQGKQENILFEVPYDLLKLNDTLRSVINISA